MGRLAQTELVSDARADRVDPPKDKTDNRGYKSPGLAERDKRQRENANDGRQCYFGRFSTLQSCQLVNSFPMARVLLVGSQVRFPNYQLPPWHNGDLDFYEGSRLIKLDLRAFLDRAEDYHVSYFVTHGLHKERQL